jgi:aspartate carbamoyltransferase catalytic subunit
MDRGAPEAQFGHRLFARIEGLSPDDINHVLDPTGGDVEPNRPAEKKCSLLRGRTIINRFFENSDDKGGLGQ